MSVLDRKGLRALIRSAGAGDNPPSGQSLLYPKVDGWYSRASDGTEVKLGGGAGADLATANTWTGLQTFQSAGAGLLAAKFADVGGVVQATVDEVGVWRSGGRRTSPLTSRLTSAAASTTTTYGGTGLSLSVVAAGVYIIRARGQYRTSATTTGIGLRVGGTATATAIRYSTTIFGLSATTYTHQTQTAMGVAAAASTGVAAINTDYGWLIDGLIRVNAAGTLTVDYMSEVAATTATVQPDSFLELQEVA